MPLKYLSPLVDAYSKRSYDALETAIFPDFFHGKCQDPKTNIDPPGCPNPDCPVVCGTPGSMVHFYANLTEIAFKQTEKTLVTLTTPGSDVYKKIEAAIEEDAKWQNSRMVRRFARSSKRRLDCKKRTNKLDADLREILKQLPSKMMKACGGSDYPDCSWEEAMKEYILSFP